MTNDFIFPAKDYILIGKVAQPHGLKGEIKILPFSGQPENILDYKQLFIISRENELSPALPVRSCRVQKKFAIVSLEKITTRDQSEEMVGMGVLIKRNALKYTQDNQYYWHDLIDKPVTLQEDSQCIGTVKSLFYNGAQDVIVVSDKNNKELFIPVTKTILVEMNEQGIVINPPPGLLTVNSGDSD